MKKEMSLRKITMDSNRLDSIFSMTQSIFKHIYLFIFFFLICFSLFFFSKDDLSFIFIFPLFIAFFIFKFLLQDDIKILKSNLSNGVFENKKYYIVAFFKFSFFRIFNCDLKLKYTESILKKKTNKDIMNQIDFKIDNLIRFRIILYLLNNYNDFSNNEKSMFIKNKYILEILSINNDFLSSELNYKSSFKNKKNILESIKKDMIKVNISNF
jgi:hypothetical protein